MEPARQELRLPPVVQAGAEARDFKAGDAQAERLDQLVDLSPARLACSSFSYAMNRMRDDQPVDPRARALLQTLHAVLLGPPTKRT